MSAREVIQAMGRDLWDRYFKFSIERNPWDRFVSYYFYATHSIRPRPSIAEFVRGGAPRVLKEQGWGLYTINGRVVVDRLCRFESLPEELERVRMDIGLPEPLLLPHAKGGFRTDPRSYRELLGETERRIIARTFNDEIELLGYAY
jgi:hypothetical protein